MLLVFPTLIHEISVFLKGLGAAKIWIMGSIQALSGFHFANNDPRVLISPWNLKGDQLP